MKVRVKAIFVLVMFAAVFCMTACGPSGDPDPKDPGSDPSVLVAYFSATGTTEGVAQKLVQATGGEVFVITPAQSYTSADLDYGNNSSRATREQNDPTARPEMSGAVEDMAKYDVVFLGYPIWWGRLPKIIYTFLDEYDLSGKTVVPFCTSGGSSIATSVEEIRAEEPGANVLDGRRFNGSDSLSVVKDWVDGLGLNIEKEAKEVNVYCGNNKLQIELADNPSAKAFAKKLRDGDVTVVMDDFGGFEKVGSLGFSLDRSDTRITTSPGDVILYQGNSITIYYDVNTWDFTLLGKIKNMTRETMLEFFGGAGRVTVRFSLN